MRTVQNGTLHPLKVNVPVDATDENCADVNPPVEGQSAVDATDENCARVVIHPLKVNVQ